jgi:hypothetical protein
MWGTRRLGDRKFVSDSPEGRTLAGIVWTHYDDNIVPRKLDSSVVAEGDALHKYLWLRQAEPPIMGPRTPE